MGSVRADVGMKPYYQDEDVTLYLGNSFEVEWPKADVILTDPPYGEHQGAGWWGRAAILGIIYPIGLLPLAPTVVEGLTYRWSLAASSPEFWLPCLVYTDATKMFLPTNDSVHFESLTMGEHPHAKPVEMVQFFLSHLAAPGQTVLDPFTGSGSSLLAARNLGCKAIGFEMEEEFCEAAARLLDNPQSQV